VVEILEELPLVTETAEEIGNTHLKVEVFMHAFIKLSGDEVTNEL